MAGKKFIKIPGQKETNTCFHAYEQKRVPPKKEGKKLTEQPPYMQISHMEPEPLTTLLSSSSYAKSNYSNSIIVNFIYY